MTAAVEAKAKRGFGLGQAALLGALVWAGAFAASLLAPVSVPFRAGLATGALTGGLGGAIGFALVVPVLGKSVQTAIASMSLGFLARLILVAAGLLVTLRSLEGDPMGFVLAFFPLHFVFTALEMLVVVRHAPASPAPEAIVPQQVVPQQESSTHVS